MPKTLEVSKGFAAWFVTPTKPGEQYLAQRGGKVAYKADMGKRSSVRSENISRGHGKYCIVRDYS